MVVGVGDCVQHHNDCFIKQYMCPGKSRRGRKLGCYVLCAITIFSKNCETALIVKERALKSSSLPFSHEEEQEAGGGELFLLFLERRMKLHVGLGSSLTFLFKRTCRASISTLKMQEEWQIWLVKGNHLQASKRALPPLCWCTFRDNVIPSNH